jgi:hypothetical protein
MDDPNIQRGAYSTKGAGDPSKGTPVSGRVTERQALKDQASLYDIDTRGMTTKQIDAAVGNAQKVQEDLANFIQKTVEGMGRKQGANPDNNQGVEITTRKSVDAPSGLNPNSLRPKANPADAELEFYCYTDKGIGSVMIPSRGWSPL